MTRSNSTQNQIQELKRKISAIQWDLPNLKNEEIKDRREKELSTAKSRLDELIRGEK
ncbi:hypothetical protein ISS05_02800 [Candidatus Woesearchaeota archaeon]|nr:hypothetical protein [Candidatus Woesearchaeota archaeon]